MSNIRAQLRSIIDKAVEDALAAYRALLAVDKKSEKTVKRPGVGKKVSAALTGRTCPVPGCGKLGKGPRFRFFCDDHKGLPAADQARILAEARVATGDGKPATQKRPAKAAAKPAPKHRGWRSPEQVASTIEKVLAFIGEHPGLTSEDIARQMGANRMVTKDTLSRLRAQKKVKTSGAKRSMTYSL
jgi:hypothetical protein